MNFTALAGIVKNLPWWKFNKPLYDAMEEMAVGVICACGSNFIYLCQTNARHLKMEKLENKNDIKNTTQ